PTYGQSLSGLAHDFKKKWPATCRRVWQKFLADLTPLLQFPLPVAVPLVTLVQGFQSHEGLGVGGIPAHAGAFQTSRQRFAGRLGRAAANLPVFAKELRIADHVPPFAYLVE